jgi:hypothetical protein
MKRADERLRHPWGPHGGQTDGQIERERDRERQRETETETERNTDTKQTFGHIHPEHGHPEHSSYSTAIAANPAPRPAPVWWEVSRTQAQGPFGLQFTADEQ